MTGRPSLILTTSVAFLFPIAMLFSLFLLFAGHNAPGGGFIGGLVAGAAYVMRYMSLGLAAEGVGLRVGSQVVLGAGLVIAVGTGALGWFVGEQFLESAYFEEQLPVLGKVKAGTPLLFDIGVYLVVVGLVLTVLRTLGDERDPGVDG